MTSLFPRRVVAAAASGVMLGGLLGCSAVMKPVRVVGLAQKDLVLQVQIDPDANFNSAIRVDVVTADSKKTATTISALTSTQWFAQRGDLQRMMTRQIGVTTFEWTPGEKLPDVHVPGTIGKDAVVLFVNYASPGPHNAMLPAVGKVQVHLGVTDFSLVVPGVPPASGDSAPPTVPDGIPSMPEAPAVPKPALPGSSPGSS